MSKLLRSVMFAVVCGLVLVGPVGGPSQAGATGRTAQVSQVQDVSAGWSSARTAKHKKHHKKKHRKHRKHKRHAVSSASRCWPGNPTLGASRLQGAVLFRWGATSCTTRYRVHLSPAWYGEWPGTPWYTPWTSYTARSQMWKVPSYPHAHDAMMAVAYANPIFARLEANNSRNARRTATHVSRWIPQWAAAPIPKAGDPIRFGSYNVMLYPTGTRAGVVARNIGSHGLTMVALQEARQSTASAVVSYLNKLYSGTWDYVRASGATVSTPGQQIVYRKDKFSLSRSGVMNLYNYKDPRNRVVAPWAAFRANHGGGYYGKTFYVTSQHFAGTARSSLSQNGQTGQAAAVVINYMKNLTGGPVIVAGDLRYGREPWGERAGYVPAQPTFVRNGYYDAMASRSMHGQNYSEVNIVGGKPSARQRPNPSGLGSRSDHILLRGFTGSKTYVNQVNWSFNGMVPSDHNLIYSDIAIPF
jgi:hypothetical protein